MFFWCNDNELTSLKGVPKEIHSNFICSGNKLTSLKGAPKEVHGDFYCFENNLTSLKGSPKEVHGKFDCSFNDLSTLEGAPEVVQGVFNCTNNPKLKSLDDLLGTKIEGNLYTDLDTTEFKEHQKVFKLAHGNMSKYKRLMKLRNNS